MHLRAWGLVLVLLASACGTSSRDLAVERAPDAVTTSSTVEPTTTSVPSPPESLAAPAAPVPSTSTSSSAPSVESVPVAPGTVEPYRGLGAWLDRYDWSVEWAGPNGSPVGVEAIDHMAAEGVQTLYIQTSYWEDDVGVIEPERLGAILSRARDHGIAVVGWYLPAFVDPAKDLEHIMAMAALGIEGVAIDIEGTQVDDVEERSRRLVALSAELRRRLPGQAIGGIVLEPVLIEDLSATYWPDFPWTEIEPYYDVWMPMAYWTNRVGEWRSAYRYTSTNIVRVRSNLGDEDAMVHPIGGVGTDSTAQDLQEMLQASAEHGAIGGSIYDYATSRPEFWDVLRGFRNG